VNDTTLAIKADIKFLNYALHGAKKPTEKEIELASEVLIQLLLPAEEGQIEDTLKE
jgi:hypothetical protein